MTSLLVKKVPMENKCSITFGGSITLLALFAQEKHFGQLHNGDYYLKKKFPWQKPDVLRSEMGSVFPVSTEFPVGYVYPTWCKE